MKRSKNARAANIMPIIFTKQKCCAIMLDVRGRHIFSLIKVGHEEKEKILSISRKRKIWIYKIDRQKRMKGRRYFSVQ